MPFGIRGEFIVVGAALIAASAAFPAAAPVLLENATGIRLLPGAKFKDEWTENHAAATPAAAGSIEWSFRLSQIEKDNTGLSRTLSKSGLKLTCESRPRSLATGSEPPAMIVLNSLIDGKGCNLYGSRSTYYRPAPKPPALAAMIHP
ncbi:MAG: hypothetical protein WDO70_01000 [Alphaproteobacteria bacterium]